MSHMCDITCGMHPVHTTLAAGPGSSPPNSPRTAPCGAGILERAFRVLAERSAHAARRGLKVSMRASFLEIANNEAQVLPPLFRSVTPQLFAETASRVAHCTH